MKCQISHSSFETESDLEPQSFEFLTLFFSLLHPMAIFISFWIEGKFLILGSSVPLELWHMHNLPESVRDSGCSLELYLITALMSEMAYLKQVLGDRGGSVSLSI